MTSTNDAVRVRGDTRVLGALAARRCLTGVTPPTLSDVSSRDRILARRAQFVAAAVALVGCREPEPLPPPRPRPATPEASAALAGPPRDAGSDAAPVDTDHDGIPDEHDKCPDVFGTVLKEGCPGPCLTIIPVTTLEIRERIYFAASSAKIAPQSYPVLDAIAAAIKQNPELVVVEVRGHIALGEPKDVSDKRARAVERALVDRGVDPKQLTRADLGSTTPAVSGYSPAAAEKNRRVDFEVK